MKWEGSTVEMLGMRLELPSNGMGILKESALSTQGQPPQMGIIPETEAILSCTFSSVIWGWRGQRAVLTYTAQRVKTGARFSAVLITPLTSAQLKKGLLFFFFNFRADLAQSLL